MSALTDLYIDDAYVSLLHSNSTELPASGQADMYDGAGNKSALKLGRSCNGATVCGNITCDSLLVNEPASVMAFMLDTIYPINSIYLTVVNVNPGTHLGGTWIQTAAGKMLAGAGNGMDGNGDIATFSVGLDLGRYKHTPTIDEMPAHSHHEFGPWSPSYTPITSNPEGVPAAGGPGDNANNYVIVNAEGGPTIGSTSIEGSAKPTPFSIIPPYFAVYVWVRTE